MRSCLKKTGPLDVHLTIIEIMMYKGEKTIIASKESKISKNLLKGKYIFCLTDKKSLFAMLFLVNRISLN